MQRDGWLVLPIVGQEDVERPFLPGLVLHKCESIPPMRPKGKGLSTPIRANAKSPGRSHLCPCEERSDEAISTLGMGDCFASLAMTYAAVRWNNLVFALIPAAETDISVADMGYLIRRVRLTFVAWASPGVISLRSMGILPMCITGVSPVKAGPGWPCDSWAGRPCYEGRKNWAHTIRCTHRISLPEQAGMGSFIRRGPDGPVSRGGWTVSV
jgi:hypothetical protein